MKTSKNDELILSALLSSTSMREAAEKCGISERTIYHHLEKPEFKQRYDAERRRLYEESAAALQTHLNGAIETMAEICMNKEISSQTRLNAAENVIKYSLKLSERADILDRLEALERGRQ